MREIKFRAWDGKEKIMWIDIHLTDVDSDDGSNGFLVDRIRNGKLEESFLFGNYSDEHIVWMQYTGLHDKNGKEIYEGDVVLGKFNLDEVEDYIYLTLTEEEKKTQSKLFHIEDIFYPYTNPIPEDLEIIGNVYENPELLSKLKDNK